MRAMTRIGRWSSTWSSPSRPRWRILSAASSSSRKRLRLPKRVARASAIRGGAGTRRDDNSNSIMAADLEESAHLYDAKLRAIVQNTEDPKTWTLPEDIRNRLLFGN